MIASQESLPPCPDWIDVRLVEETRSVWSPFYGRTLTALEAIEILLGIGRLIDVMEGQGP